MKLNILKGLLACGILLSASACDENSWNDKYLDGFEAPDLNAPDGKVVISYTLTATDYRNIAKMEANVAKAKAAACCRSSRPWAHRATSPSRSSRATTYRHGWTA